MKEIADILIIGSGACGAAAAWSLSQECSLKIVCLEQGAPVNPADYPANRAEWELGKVEAFNSNPSIRRNLADYPIDNSRSPISIANYNGFGGSTILYSGLFPRLHPSDFKVKTLDGVAQDWPLSYEDLIPHFRQNEAMMGVAGMVGDPAYPEYPPLLPPIPLGKMGHRMAEIFNKLAWHWWPSYSAINTTNHLNRRPCINLGPCNSGCPQGAKASVDVTYWPAALANGVEVRTGCRVHEITLDTSSRANGARYIDADNKEQHIQARIVVVACSGIGTPRLLLNSKSTAFPSGLINETGLVGKNLMLHPLGFTEAVFDDDLGSSFGPQGCTLMSHEFYETDPSRDFVRGYAIQVLRGAPPVETATNGYFMRQIPIGKDHHKHFRRIFNHNVGIAVISEDLPEEHNRIELDPDHCDASGMPGVRVHYKMGENTVRMLKHGLEKSRHFFNEAGAKVISAFAPVKHTGWHLMGTVRMGTDPATSVVNQYGQAHSVNNLFIVDSSIFVTSAGLNPIATSQALTLYACDYIRKNLKQLVCS